MTVKNYVLDINKTSLQHPSIVLRQDDYNIYTINISVTENGTPVDLGSYTLNFLGITPAGAKIIDSKNFITNAGDLKNGKFSYKFPKEAAGSKGVYDVAYFRLSTTSGATSTIDLNLRVLGGIDLTADEVKDYITIDDTLRNTLIAEVFKKVDAKVDEHLATVVKGDKGDKGDPGKDGYMPVIGGRNYIFNSSGGSLGGWGYTENTWSVTTDSTRGNVFTLTPTTTWTGSGVNSISQTVNAKIIGKQVTVSFWAKSSVTGAKFHSEPQGGLNEFNPNLTTTWAKYSYTISSFSGTIYFMAVEAGTTYYLDDIKLELGNIATDWVPALEDVPINDSQLVHKTGNETIAGDKTFTGKLSANNLNVSGDTPNTVLTYNSGFSGGISYYFVRNKTVHMFLINVQGFTASGQRPLEVPNSLRTSVPGSTYFVGMYGISNTLVGFNGTQVYISTSSVPYKVDTPLNAHLTWQLP